MPVHRMKTGNDASPDGGAQKSRASVSREGREALRDLSHALAAARRMMDAGDARVREHMREHPYVTLGAAATAGYVLGAGVPGWAARGALRLGARMLIMAVMQDRLFGDAEPSVAEEP